MTRSQINNVCIERYGAGFLAVDGTCALWLADHILTTAGVNVYKTISSARRKMGKYTAFPSYGTALFAGI